MTNFQFYYGEDTFTLGREIKTLKAGFAGMVEELETGDLPDGELKNRLQEVLQNQTLFSKKKLVILKNFLAVSKSFPASEEYLTGIIAGRLEEVTVVVIETDKFDKRLKFFKALQKAAQTREFNIPVGRDLENWIREYLGNQGFKIETAALGEFIRLLGQNEEERMYDLWQVSSELEKLMLLAHAEKLITISHVREVVKPNISQNIFQLTNLFAEGKNREAMFLLEKMMSSSAAAELKTQTIQIIGGLGSQIRSLLLVKDLERESPAKIASLLGWKEGRVWINSKLAKKFSTDKLVGMLRDLRALDLRLKTSEEPPKLLLSLFLLRRPESEPRPESVGAES